MAPDGGSGPLVARRWVLSGRVQGVGFRWFVLNRAQALGVRGWVRNTDEGDVEVVALASAATVERLDALLIAGPPGAHVTAVRRDEVQQELVEGKSFTIKH